MNNKEIIQNYFYNKAYDPKIHVKIGNVHFDKEISGVICEYFQVHGFSCLEEVSEPVLVFLKMFIHGLVSFTPEGYHLATEFHSEAYCLLDFLNLDITYFHTSLSDGLLIEVINRGNIELIKILITNLINEGEETGKITPVVYSRLKELFPYPSRLLFKIHYIMNTESEEILFNETPEIDRAWFYFKGIGVEEDKKKACKIAKEKYNSTKDPCDFNMYINTQLYARKIYKPEYLDLLRKNWKENQNQYSLYDLVSHLESEVRYQQMYIHVRSPLKDEYLELQKHLLPVDFHTEED